MQIAVVTGEASGDRVGGQLVAEIKRLRPDAVVWGTGGRYLRDAGAEVVLDSSGWGIVGISAALALLPRIIRARGLLFRELLRRRPDVIIPVDAGAFNLGFGPIEGLCSWARRNLPATKILYYFPPGSWRRTLRSTTLGRVTNRVATPFPWSETELNRLGADATFVGHPLLDLVRPEMPVTEFAAQYHIDCERPIVGILPGSRRQEIDQILPLQLNAAEIISRRVPGVQFVVALAPTVDRAAVIAQLERVQKARAAASDQTRARDSVNGGNSGGRTPIPVPVGGQRVNGDELARRQREWIRRASETPAPSSPGLALVIVENATYDVMAASDVLMIASGTATLEAAILGKPMVIVYKLAASIVNRIEYQFVKNNLPPFFGMPNLLAQRRICPELVQDAATPEAVAGEVIGLLLEPDRLLQMRSALQEVVELLGESGGARRAAEMVVALAEKSAGERPGDAHGM